MRCECGEPIEPEQKFCIGCGKELGDSSQSDKTAVLPPIVPDEPDPAPQPKKKRVWHKVIIAIVVVIALILAGVLGFVWLWPKDSMPTADKDTVHYSDTKASKVHRKTVIVLYGKDGKPLEKYELKVKDEDGKVTSHSVKDGQFTPESIGMKPDKQYTVVRMTRRMMIFTITSSMSSHPRARIPQVNRPPLVPREQCICRITT